MRRSAIVLILHASTSGLRSFGLPSSATVLDCGWAQNWVQSRGWDAPSCLVRETMVVGSSGEWPAGIEALRRVRWWAQNWAHSSFEACRRHFIGIGLSRLDYRGQFDSGDRIARRVYSSLASRWQRSSARAPSTIRFRSGAEVNADPAPAESQTT